MSLRRGGKSQDIAGWDRTTARGYHPTYENGIMARLRTDKWLWAARFFKTRALARRACELGRIVSNGQQAKASREVRVGDRLQVKNAAGDFDVEVLLLSEMRGPAA